ncbi:hypothetical protein CTU88_16120 [Streptomyces sp. JV178]|nr:hypothetical protein CTU88_16120 [Streptomyces sp. JV178]
MPGRPSSLFSCLTHPTRRPSARLPHRVKSVVWLPSPRAEPVRSRRRAIAVEGKCMRGVKRPDGSRVFASSTTP